MSSNTQRDSAWPAVPTSHTIKAVLSDSNDRRMWAMEGMTVRSFEATMKSPLVKIIGQLDDGSSVPCTKRVPIKRIQAMSVALDDTIAFSGLALESIDSIVVPTPSLEALAKIIGIMLQPDVEEVQGELGKILRTPGIGRMEHNPFLNCYQIAKLAQSLVMRPIQLDMCARIRAMFYNPTNAQHRDGWGIAIGDAAGIFKRIEDPKHWVKHGILESIARADLKGRLRGRKALFKFLWEEWTGLARIVEELKAEFKAEVRESQIRM